MRRTLLLRRLWRVAGVALVLVVSACAQPPSSGDAAAPAARLQAYRQVMLRMDYDRAAGFFTPDGQVSHADGAPIRGREAVRTFLKSFSAYKVLDYRLSVDRTDVDGAQTVQHGRFAQSVTLPQGNTVQVNGLFEATWQRDVNGQWLLARMHTMPPK